MTANELRQKYLDFFKDKIRKHIEIPPAPLVLENDATTLFTSSGMQPLVPYLLGQTHPEGKRLVDVQPSLRVGDIEEVGDRYHTTFFEMLGNWSLGDYFKKEQLPWFWEFLTKELKLDPEKLYVTVFEGNDQVPEDKESEEIWKSLGISDDHIYKYGVEKNWWSRSGTPEQMPVGEIGGPDSEVFYEFTEIEHDKKFGEKCHPNCECGRFLEIGNSVFIQYKKNEQGKLEELPQKNVDFGGGLERLTAATENTPDIFQIDLFQPLIEQLEQKLQVKYEDNDEIKKSLRIITDHLKASVFLMAEGLEPSNKSQGYILRRLLRRAVLKTFSIKQDFDSKDFRSVVEVIFSSYPDYFKSAQVEKILEMVSLEVRKFRSSIEKGLREFNKLEKINGKIAFDLFQTYGFPIELTEELALEKGQKINREEFRAEFEKHKELSRTASAGMFKGGLGEQSEITTKYHTATHLLHAALRKVLGEHVQQKGSNITSERLRFDFSHPEKLTEEQIKQVENIVNEKIKEGLEVTSEVLDKNEALKSGALGFFTEKYGKMVSVYSIGNPSTLPRKARDHSGSLFSKEICGGPHVKNTKELGTFKIIKEESASSGIRRVYAALS